MLSGYFWLAAGGALIGSFQMGFQLAIMNCSMAAVAQSLQRPEATAGALIVRACCPSLEKGLLPSRQARTHVPVAQVSSLLLGACVGALFAGRCADAFGPRTMLLVINVFLVSGAFVSAAAQGYSELLVGKGKARARSHVSAVLLSQHTYRAMQVASCVVCKWGQSRCSYPAS